MNDSRILTGLASTQTLDAQMDALRDDELLEYIGARSDEDDAEAGAAFVVLHRRYASSVFGFLVRLTENHALAEDLSIAVFMKIWKKANTIHVAVGEEGNSSKILGGWIKKTVHNSFKDYLRSKPFGEVLVPDFVTDEEVVKQVNRNSQHVQEEFPPSEKLSEEKRLIREALTTLSEKEQHAVMLTYSQRSVGEPFARLSNEDSAQLAKDLSTTPENVRQIRCRTMKKIKEYCDKNSSHDRKQES